MSLRHSAEEQRQAVQQRALEHVPGASGCALPADVGVLIALKLAMKEKTKVDFVREEGCWAGFERGRRTGGGGGGAGGASITKRPRFIH